MGWGGGGGGGGGGQLQKKERVLTFLRMGGQSLHNIICTGWVPMVETMTYILCYCLLALATLLNTKDASSTCAPPPLPQSLVTDGSDLSFANPTNLGTVPAVKNVLINEGASFLCHSAGIFGALHIGGWNTFQGRGPAWLGLGAH